MRRNGSLASDVSARFKEMQQLVQAGLNNKQKTPTRGFESVRSKSKTMTNTNLRDKYKKKRLEEKWEEFTTSDLTYYFEDIAKENGVNYVTNSISSSRGTFKLCISKGRSPLDLVCMIDFLFTSNQDYLDITTLSPFILKSGFGNQIYQDTALWIDDKYVNKSTKKFSKREWTEDVNEESSKLDEWGY